MKDFLRKILFPRAPWYSSISIAFSRRSLNPSERHILSNYSFLRIFNQKGILRWAKTRANLELLDSILCSGCGCVSENDLLIGCKKLLIILYRECVTNCWMVHLLDEWMQNKWFPDFDWQLIIILRILFLCLELFLKK